MRSRISNLLSRRVFHLPISDRPVMVAVVCGVAGGGVSLRPPAGLLHRQLGEHDGDSASVLGTRTLAFPVVDLVLSADATNYLT